MWPWRKSGRKALDLDACRVAYIRHIREVASGRATGAEVNHLTAERARLAREQADGQSIKNAISRQQLLPRAEITRAVVASFQHVRDRLSALPARLAGPMARMTEQAETRAALTRAVDEVLCELSESRIIAATEEQADAA